MTRFDGMFTGGVISAVISGRRKGSESRVKQVRVRPFEKKGQTLYQFTFTLPDREIHENLEPAAAAERVDSLLRGEFTQAVIYTSEADWHAVSMGKLRLHKKPPTKKPAELTHDRKKPRILEEGVPHDFLVKLGVMTPDGKVKRDRYDKFRQINRYLELAAGSVPKPEGRPVRIIDFGCGKAYLTFAMYYYLRNILKIECEMTGLDLKRDVVEFCEGTARALGYDGLRFSAGDISDWEESGTVDMVVTLHACDTATDAAIAKAVGWGAPVIMTVPCCQHELFYQINSEVQHPLLRHGILRERTAALVTDAARAQLLESVGYKVDVMEFVDMEHTPKNIMIRAIRKNGVKYDEKAFEEYKSFRDSWGVQPCLERLMFGGEERETEA